VAGLVKVFAAGVADWATRRAIVSVHDGHSAAAAHVAQLSNPSVRMALREILRGGHLARTYAAGINDVATRRAVMELVG
jgi:hypothetical protein